MTKRFDVGLHYQLQEAPMLHGDVVSKRIRIAERLFKKHIAKVNNLLDIGCGEGSVTLYLKNSLNANAACGIDIAEAYIESARKKGITAFQCDLNEEDLPFPDNSFDAIFVGEIIEHLVDPDHLLDEVRRVLADGGVMVLTATNLGAWFNRLALLLGWQPLWTGTSFYHDVGRPRIFQIHTTGCDHLRCYTLRALKELCSLKGFTHLKAAGAPTRERERELPLHLALGSWADGLLSRFPSLAAHVVIVMSKASATVSTK